MSKIDFKFIHNSTYSPKPSVLFIVDMLCFVKPSLLLFFHRVLCDSGLGQEINLTRKQLEPPRRKRSKRALVEKVKNFDSEAENKLQYISLRSLAGQQSNFKSLKTNQGRDCNSF